MKMHLALMLATAMLVGCDNTASEGEPSTAPDTLTETVRAGAEEAKRIGAETAETIAVAAEEQKEAIGSAERLLSSIGSKLDAWKEQAADQGAALKTESAEALKALDEKKSALMTKLESLKDESSETWQEVKPDLEAAVDDLKRAYDKVADRFVRDNPPAEPVGD